MSDRYHHGSLRQAVLDRAAQVITDEGPGSFSLRSLAVDLGVSHTAPLHHFGSREGVLTALAADGFADLSRRLVASREGGGSFIDSGVAYVQFALDRPAHFQVMFTPTLLDETDPELTLARQATFDELRSGVEAKAAGASSADAAAAVIAAWAMVHGIATLAQTGNLDSSQLRQLLPEPDLLDITRRSASMLYGSNQATS